MTSYISCFLALAGCLSASTNSLVTEPDQGLTPIYDLIRSAKSTLDMTMYELTDTQAEQLLLAAAASGVRVRVILDQNLEKKNNTAAYEYLSSEGVAVHWANPAYSATHQKTITVDGATSAIMTLNLTSQYYSTSRDFAVIENDPADVAAIEVTFEADFADSAITPPDGDDLAWSPANSESAILNVVNSANHSLLVENEEMSDTDVIDALINAAGRGVLVQVVMTNTSNEYATEFNQLTAAGVEVSTYASTASLYIHAKVILADYGSPGAQVFIGSENFSNASLTRNRELGLTLVDPAIMQSTEAGLTSDFTGGQPWTGSPAGFSVQASSPSLTLATGNQGSITIAVATFDAFSSAVTFTVSGVPDGVTAAFAPSTIAAPGSGTATLTLSASASATPGGYTINISGQGGNLTETTGLNLQIATAVAVNSASMQPGFGSGAWVTIFGANLSPVTDSWADSVVDGRVPTSLDGVAVTIGGQPAYPSYISPTQINAVAPAVGPGTVPFTVTAPGGVSVAGSAVVQAAQPAFFQWGSYAVATHLDGSRAVKGGTFPGAAVPAAPGEAIILWGTGFGPTVPAAPVGAVVPTGTIYYTANPVTVTFGNTPAMVYSAVLSPGYAALYQVAIQVPESLADGDYPVVATVSGVESPMNVLLTVRH